MCVELNMGTHRRSANPCCALLWVVELGVESRHSADQLVEGLISCESILAD